MTTPRESRALSVTAATGFLVEDGTETYVEQSLPVEAFVPSSSPE